MTEAKYEEFFQVFNPSQLLRMLNVIAMQATNIEPICVKISKRFIEEANDVQKRRNGNNKKLTTEDSEQVTLWHLRVKDILNLNTSGPKKYSLLNLVVEIISLMSEFRNQQVLADEIARSMSTDLLTNDISMKELCRGWSRCLKHISWIDEFLHKDLLNRFKKHVDTMPPEGCFDAFLSNDGSYAQELSDILFERAVKLFEEKKDIGLFQRGKDYVKGWFGPDQNKARSQNLCRLFSRCVESVQPPDDHHATVVKCATELPSLSNMMQFYPGLEASKLLKPQIDIKVKLILKKVQEFVVELKEGTVTLESLFLLTDPARVDRLLTLVESHHEAFKCHHGLDRTSLISLIKVRLAELDEYFQAQDYFKSFKSKFDQVGCVSYLSVNIFFLEMSENPRRDCIGQVIWCRLPSSQC